MTLFEEYPYLNDWKTIAQGAEAVYLIDLVKLENIGR